MPVVLCALVPVAPHLERQLGASARGDVGRTVADVPANGVNVADPLKAEGLAK